MEPFANHHVKPSNSSTKTLSPGPVPETAPALRWIFLYASLAIIPLTTSVALLGGLIVRYLIHVEPTKSTLPWDHVHLTDAYYVDYSLSKLLVIASWMSTISMLLPGAAMALLSYVLSRKWYMASSQPNGDVREIPTALQAALLFGVLGPGGLPSLWKTAVWVLVAAVVLGGFITAADTWLHKVSSTVLFTATREITDTRQFQAYGRTAVPYCLLTQVSQIVTDVLDKANTNRCRGDFYYPIDQDQHLYNYDTSIASILNVSSTDLISVHGNHSIVLPNPISPFIDYTASIYALSTSCHLANPDCQEKRTGDTMEFNCSQAGFPIFSGKNIATTGISWGNESFIISTNSSGTEAMPVTNGTSSNPFTFAYRGVSSIPIHFNKDPRAFGLDSISTQIPIFICNTTIYDATYTFLNGSITEFSPVIANETIAKTFTIIINGSVEIRSSIIQGILVLSSRKQNSTFDTIMTDMAEAFSRILLGSITSWLVPRQNLSEKHKQQRLVARLPKVPLWILIVLCGIYVVFMIILMVLATKETMKDKKTTVERQVRMGIEGLAAEAFGDAARGGRAGEGAEWLFEERHGKVPVRIGLRTNEGGGVEMVLVRSTK